MGSLQAMEFAERTDLRTGIEWHLRGNHHPPIPLAMVDPCIRAIKKARKGDYFRRVRMPDGIKHRGYGKLVPVHEMVRCFHLDAWVQVEEDF